MNKPIQQLLVGLLLCSHLVAGCGCDNETIDSRKSSSQNHPKDLPPTPPSTDSSNNGTTGSPNTPRAT